MLFRPGSDQPLPPNDLVFLGFYLTAHRTLYEIDNLRQLEQFGASLETWLGGDEEPASGPRPYLAWTPLLARLPARIQLDLLAETWRRHDARRAYRATLADGCVVGAACLQARLLLEEDDEFAEELLEDSPRQPDLRLDEWTRERLRLLYPRWWRNFNPLEFRDFAALGEEFTARQVAQLRGRRAGRGRRRTWSGTWPGCSPRRRSAGPVTCCLPRIDVRPAASRSGGHHPPHHGLTDVVARDRATIPYFGSAIGFRSSLR